MNQVSDDGDVLCWTTRRLLRLYSSTKRVQPKIGMPITAVPETVVHRNSDGREWTLPGEAALSRNGRWVWTSSRALDLASGQEYDVSPAFRIASGISDEGDTVVLQETNLAGLLRPGGQFRPLPEGIRPAQVILMDRHASTLVWNTGSSTLGEGQLKKLDVATGTITVLVDTCPNCEPLQLSADGRRLLVATRSIDGAPGVWVLDTLSLQRTDLAPGYAAAAAITSSGQTVCYSGSEGMLQCRDLESGDVRAVVGKTAQVAQWAATPDEFPAPGSRYTLKGTGLQDAAVSVNGTPAKVAASTDTAITFLVPESVEPGQAEFSFEQESSPFRSSLAHELRAIAPRVIKLAEIPGAESIGWLPYLENGTRGGLAGEFEPLHPGEVVWIHMVGLGRDPSLMLWYWQDWIGGPLHDIAPFEITQDDGWYTVKIRIPEAAPNGISVVKGRSPWDPSISTGVEIPIAPTSAQQP
ncbi:hypothetical protein [Paludibaculum fermentans]|uniref:IPT/TIG domain-containing protein n=1 Tax=Paludibaculum fermentans TaxID=1473598 RepID=A0A7S7NMS8_PALFE|nr:hypothetical protein [Paludibaculum fermentans]QOY86516.1 hypothetical protein IRI77_27495 [Paludibaculum fermentans]